MPSGRFAPSPSGPLHLGNLRTALAAWLFARHDGSAFLLRFDDLDTASTRDEYYGSQADDLIAIGLDWDGEPLRQSDHLDRYRQALAELVTAELVYPCFCSRREIREAARAPNRPLSGHAYPGTCRRLTDAQRTERLAAGRAPALRLRSDEADATFTDLLAGPVRCEIDDFVVCRNDGTPAYHLVTVLDDAAAGVELVVRADDLVDSTGRQRLLCRLLDLPQPEHAHVPLVLAPSGERLAKRHGAVTLADRRANGERPADVVRHLATTLGQPTGDLGDVHDPAALCSELARRFDPTALPTQPLVLDLGGRIDQSNSSDTV